MLYKQTAANMCPAQRYSQSTITFQHVTCLAYCPPTAWRNPQIKAHNLAPALEWAQQHRSKLSHDGAPGGFEFRLHELNFINTLGSSGQAAALQYAQQHFAPFRVSWPLPCGLACNHYTFVEPDD